MPQRPEDRHVLEIDVADEETLDQLQAITDVTDSVTAKVPAGATAGGRALGGAAWVGGLF